MLDPPSRGPSRGNSPTRNLPSLGFPGARSKPSSLWGRTHPPLGACLLSACRLKKCNKATPTGEVPDTPTEVTKSCDTPAGPGDSTPDLRVKPDDFAPGSVPVMAGSVASRSDVMETDCAGGIVCTLYMYTVDL